MIQKVIEIFYGYFFDEVQIFDNQCGVIESVKSKEPAIDEKLVQSNLVVMISERGGTRL